MARPASKLYPPGEARRLREVLARNPVGSVGGYARSVATAQLAVRRNVAIGIRAARSGAPNTYHAGSARATGYAIGAGALRVVNGQSIGRSDTPARAAAFASYAGRRSLRGT